MFLFFPQQSGFCKRSDTSYQRRHKFCGRQHLVELHSLIQIKLTLSLLLLLPLSCMILEDFVVPSANLMDEGGTIPASPPTMSHQYWREGPDGFLILELFNDVCDNKSNHRLLWRQTPKAHPQCLHYQLRDGIQPLPPTSNLKEPVAQSAPPHIPCRSHLHRRQRCRERILPARS